MHLESNIYSSRAHALTSSKQAVSPHLPRLRQAVCGVFRLGKCVARLEEIDFDVIVLLIVRECRCAQTGF